ncbi:hypothetical protein [Microvirga sp. TS319]|uniref:hypothetical protein n=1 Tax=Microvirga sp. TS319 TaxID=3241165 RepID=UPI00351A77D8
MRGPGFDDPPVFRVDLLAPFRPVDDAAARRLVAPAAAPVFLAVVLATPVLVARFTALLEVAARVFAAGRADDTRVVFATRPERAGVALDVVAERRAGVFDAEAVVLRAVDAVLRSLDAVLRAAAFLATPVLDEPVEDARCDVLFVAPARLVPAVRPPEVPVWRELLLRPSVEAEDARAALRFVPALFAVPGWAVAFPTFRDTRVVELFVELFLAVLAAGRLAGAASVAMNLKKRLV